MYRGSLRELPSPYKKRLWRTAVANIKCLWHREAGIEAASLARDSGDEETCTEAKKLVGHSEIELGKIMAKQKAK